MRHRVLVERNSTLKDFHVSEDQPYPVQMTLKNERTGAEETVKAKFLVGSDGAASMIRKKLSIPFDGMSTDIYWGIMDCVFESDYPHAWVFGQVTCKIFSWSVITDSCQQVSHQLQAWRLRDNSERRRVHQVGAAIQILSTAEAYQQIDYTLNSMSHRLGQLQLPARLKTRRLPRQVAVLTSTPSPRTRFSSRPTGSFLLTNSGLPLRLAGSPCGRVCLGIVSRHQHC